MLEAIGGFIAGASFLSYIGYFLWREHAPCELGNHDWTAWTDPVGIDKQAGNCGPLKQTKSCTLCNKARTRVFK
jgi:hypothetical protein